MNKLHGIMFVIVCLVICGSFVYSQNISIPKALRGGVLKRVEDIKVEMIQMEERILYTYSTTQEENNRIHESFQLKKEECFDGISLYPNYPISIPSDI